MFTLCKMLALLALLSLSTSAQAVSLISTGSSVMLNEIPYYIPAAPVTTLRVHPNQFRSTISAAGLVPLTVFETSLLTFSQKDLDDTVANYTARDDVFQAGFLQGTRKSIILRHEISSKNRGHGI